MIVAAGGDTESADLIRRCVAGDGAAQAEFIAAFGPFLRGVVAKYLGGANNGYAVVSELEDLYNELLIRLLDKDRPLLQAVRDARRIHGWLSAVAHTHVIDHYRRDGARLRMLRNLCHEAREVYHPAPDQAVIAEERRDSLRRSLEQLTPQQRIALELYYLHELSYGEVADITGLSVNTVASHIRRGKRHLRDMLDAEFRGGATGEGAHG